jgi:hypothetical protein
VKEHNRIVWYVVPTDTQKREMPKLFLYKLATCLSWPLLNVITGGQHRQDSPYHEYFVSSSIQMWICTTGMSRGTNMFCIFRRKSTITEENHDLLKMTGKAFSFIQLSQK